MSGLVRGDTAQHMTHGGVGGSRTGDLGLQGRQRLTTASLVDRRYRERREIDGGREDALERQPIRTEIAARIAAGQRVAQASVLDFVGHGSLGLDQQLGGSADRHELQREAGKRGDRRVLGRSIGPPCVGERITCRRIEVLEARPARTAPVRSSDALGGAHAPGAALLVKQRHLALGHMWINNPGRLHAAMLSMGDRATLGSGGATVSSCISGDRIRCGADVYYGLGRLTLRRHNRFWMRTRTFTSSTPTTIKEVWSNPLNSNHRLVKCVMQQREDMVDPNKDNIGRIGLRIQIIGKDPQGNCSVDGGDVFMTVDDHAPDDKHMVATTDEEVTLADRCVQFVFFKHSLSSAGSVPTHTYCVAHTNLDYD
jgi:hypothetical protein